jgi:hypothetical protein
VIAAQISLQRGFGRAKSRIRSEQHVSPAGGWQSGSQESDLGDRRIVEIVGIGQAGVHREQKFQELADIGNQIGL